MVTRLSKFVSQLQQWVQPRLNSDSIKSQPSFSYSIDQPQAETVVNSPDIVISGWIATKLGQRIENLKLSDQQGLLQPLQIVERHDVIAAFPNKSTVGFYQTVPRSVLSQDQDSRFQIEFTIDGKLCHFPIDLLLSPFSYNIDLPKAGAVVNSPDIVISGWIATKLGQRIKNLKLSDQQGFLQPLQIVERHDVIAAFPNKSTVGFYQTVPRSVLSQDQDSRFQIEFTIDGQSCHFPINLATALPGITAFLARKHRKLKRIQATLRCPMCAHDQLQTRIDQSGVEVMDCNHCQTQFEFNGDRNYNFLSPELREYGKVKSTDVISDHHYDLISCAIIDEFQDGLILDVGCGLRNYYYHNVVNFEIVDYPTTDVLGIGERLPFKSNSFDVVFSFNVLEHVRQPFECAAEILRVLKPGGKLYVVAPFLQPFHGYPDHYYNMTSNGLKNLFGDRIELLEGGVPQWGSPIFCLNWFLLSYLGGLPPNVAEKFKQMRVADFLELPQTYLERDFVTKLAPAANEELACTNYLIARKLPDC